MRLVVTYHYLHIGVQLQLQHHLFCALFAVYSLSLKLGANFAELQFFARTGGSERAPLVRRSQEAFSTWWPCGGILQPRMIESGRDRRNVNDCPLCGVIDFGLRATYGCFSRLLYVLNQTHEQNVRLHCEPI